MKKLLNLIILLSSIYTFSQVGIGTTTPRGALDVNGNTLVDGPLIVKDLRQINIPTNNNTSNGPFLLVRSDSANAAGIKGEVKLLDISSRLVAPVNKYKVVLKNVNLSEVLNLNTNLRADKYVVAVTDAVFKNANTTKNSNKAFGSYSTKLSTINIGNNSYYAVNMAFMGAGPLAPIGTSTDTTNLTGDWEFSLVVFEKALVKDWGTKTGSVSSGNNYSGKSQNTPADLK